MRGARGGALRRSQRQVGMMDRRGNPIKENVKGDSSVLTRASSLRWRHLPGHGALERDAVWGREGGNQEACFRHVGFAPLRTPQVNPK